MFGVDGEAFSCSLKGKAFYMAAKTLKLNPKPVGIDEEESPTSGLQRALDPEAIPIFKFGV
eukprot:5432562-Karenia_brevis.AAC.1